MKTLSQHPGREVRPFKQRMFQDTLDAAQSLDHVRPVVVQIPELAVVALVRPPALLWRVTSRRHDAVRNGPTSEKKTLTTSYDGDEADWTPPRARTGSAGAPDTA